MLIGTLTFRDKSLYTFYSSVYLNIHRLLASNHTLYLPKYHLPVNDPSYTIQVILRESRNGHPSFQFLMDNWCTTEHAKPMDSRSHEYSGDIYILLGVTQR